MKFAVKYALIIATLGTLIYDHFTSKIFQFFLSKILFVLWDFFYYVAENHFLHAPKSLYGHENSHPIDICSRLTGMPSSEFLNPNGPGITTSCQNKMHTSIAGNTIYLIYAAIIFVVVVSIVFAFYWQKWSFLAPKTAAKRVLTAEERKAQTEKAKETRAKNDKLKMFGLFVSKILETSENSLKTEEKALLFDQLKKSYLTLYANDIKNVDITDEDNLITN